MIVNAKGFTDIINPILQSNGFIKKRDTWYKESEECICFFSFGKTDLKRFEDLMGCFLKPLMPGDEKYPPYYQNHVKYTLDRITNVNSEDDSLRRTVFSIENKKFDVNREEEVKLLLTEFAVPFLDLISTKAGIIEAIDKYPLLKYYILSAEVIKYLGIPDWD